MNKQNEKKNQSKIFEGVVVSHYQNMSVVAVNRFVKHARYGKFISRRKKYHAHDEKSDREVGESVVIKESRPLSKTKKFIVVTNQVKKF